MFFVHDFRVPQLCSKQLRGEHWTPLSPSMYFKTLGGCSILSESSILDRDDTAFIKIRKSFEFLTSFMNYL